jgi:hypothetical protein
MHLLDLSGLLGLFQPSLCDIEGVDAVIVIIIIAPAPGTIATIRPPAIVIRHDAAVVVAQYSR